MIDEFVLLGNAAIMKCLLPSFVTDFINVISWVIEENEDKVEIPIASDENNWGKFDKRRDVRVEVGCF